MSAQAVFAIAPSVTPIAPQGTTGAADAAGFAALVETATEAADGGAATAASAPKASTDEAAPEPAEAPTLLSAVAPYVPVPPVAATPDDAAPVVTGAETSAEPAPADAGSAPPAIAAPVAAEPSVGTRPPEKVPTGAHPSEHGLAKGWAKNANPNASSRAAPHQDAPFAGTPALPAEAEGATPEADAAPQAAAPAPAATPPMRALAERTAKPVDPASPSTGEAVSALMSGPKDRAAGFTTPPAAGLVAEKAMGSPGGKSVPPPAETPATSDGTSPEAAAAPDAIRAAETAVATARETSLSGLSRTTIEATSQIAAQILRRLEGRSTRFEMALLPEELGRVDIKLDIDSEGRLAARLAFDNPAAATDLRGRVDELRRQLEDAGFHLAEDAFEFAERDSGSSAFDRGHDSRGGSKRAFAAAQRLNAEADAAIPPRWMALSLSPSGVDVKV